jgi:hypothetical protein
VDPLLSFIHPRSIVFLSKPMLPILFCAPAGLLNPEGCQSIPWFHKNS